MHRPHRILGAMIITLALLAVGLTGRGPAVAAGGEHGPIVIGHRGASGYRPEHTLASYELAARMGADYIEPDLVSTSDGVLVARHENDISTTTNVSSRPEFADRKTTKTIDGREITGWFTEDFTLAELKSLRATERLPQLRQHNTVFDGRYQIPTFSEIISLRAKLSRELGRRIGIYPEIKHSTYFASIGLRIEPTLVRMLNRRGLNHRFAKVYVQSFEVSNLQWLDRRLRVPLVQLMSISGAPADFAASGDPRTYADLRTPQGLRFISEYADALGPDQNLVVGLGEDGSLAEPTGLVRRSHAAGLVVHPYTVRPENDFLPIGLRRGTNPADYGDVFAYYRALLEAGVDGFFTDTPDLGVAARREFRG